MRPAILLAFAMVLALTKPVFAPLPAHAGEMPHQSGLVLAQIDPNQPFDEKDSPPPEVPPVQPPPVTPPPVQPPPVTPPPLQPPPEEASNASSFWMHNGSIMALQAQGQQRVFVYEEPRPGILQQGAVRGTALFRGVAQGGFYSGTAFIFSNRCGSRPFPASGEVSPDSRHLVVRGRAPLLGPLCRVRGLKDVTLTFDYLSQTR